MTQTPPPRLTPPRTTAHLERLRRLVAGEIAPPPVGKLIGFVATHAELGRSVMELDTTERHANPMGTLHGGIICDLADAALGTEFSTTLEDDETFTTVDLTCKCLASLGSA